MITNITQQPHFILDATKVDMDLRQIAPICRLTDRAVTVLGGSTFDATGRNFDGVDDIVTIADSADLRFGTADFQLHTWAKAVVQTKNNGYLFTKGGQGDNAWGLYLDSAGGADDGKMKFVANSGGIFLASAEATYENDGITHLWSVIRDGTSARLYDNGVQTGSTDTSAGSDLSSNAVISVGSITTNTDFVWKGTAVRVRIATATKTFAQAERDMAVIFRRGAFSH